jgi:hypothetical protein
MGRRLIDYFPESRQERVSCQSIHFDPEFEGFTYGDPTPPKVSLQRLQEGSLLVFYAGLEGWDFRCPPAIYIIGYFEVMRAGLATSFTYKELHHSFKSNFHVMHTGVFDDQVDRLVLVKGSRDSRLLTKAVKISAMGKDSRGRPLHKLSPEMQKRLGGFDGRTSIQRSPPRWVAPEFTDRAAQFIRSLK